MSFAVGFRTLQAIHDLINLVQSVPDAALRRLSAGTPTADLSADAALDALYTLIRQDACKFDTDRTLPLYETVLLAATLPEDDFEVFCLATMILLADRLQGGPGPDDLFGHLEAFEDHYRLAEPQVYAALIQAFYGMVDMAILPPDVLRMRTFASADKDTILSGLRRITTSRDQVAADDMAARNPTAPGFAAATAERLLAVLDQRDGPQWLATHWARLMPAYCRLPEPEHSAILAGLRYVYETDRTFDPYRGALFAPSDHQAMTLPPSGPQGGLRRSFN